MGSPKEARDFLPFAADQGMPHLTGAAKAGVSVQHKQITQVGASPFAVDLAANGLAVMDDTNYCVLVGGETAALTRVQQASLTVNGFSIIGGANAEVLHVTVIGCLKGQAKPG